MDIKKYDFFKSPSLRSLLSFLHAADGIVALILALAFYYKSPLLLYGGVCAITKVFLLHLLSRMVTGEAAFGPWAITLQVTPMNTSTPSVKLSHNTPANKFTPTYPHPRVHTDDKDLLASHGIRSLHMRQQHRINHRFVP